jgi:hypothetical protein
MVDKSRPETYIPAAELLIKLTGLSAKQRKLLTLTPETAIQILQGLYQSFLEEEKYIEAALLAWGPDVFNPEPPEVQRMFSAYHEDHFVLVMGAGGLGKSYSTIAWILMDWSRDPENTNWKLISTSEAHARSNTWSTLCSLHASSIIPMPGKPQTDFLGLSNTDRQAAIAIVKIPTGDDGKARLQGFHPLPRKVPHARFGKMTRVGAFIDEAEKVPVGVWVGEDNMQTSMTAEGHVKVFAVTNPDDISSIFALKAEPEEGWQDFDPDKDFDWRSAKDYRVLRLDAKYSTNVKKKTEMFPGMQTWEGYAKLENQGIHSRSYWTFGRGCYPIANVEYNIIPAAFIRGASGNFHWLQAPTNVASFDGAFADGGDDPTVTTGRYGLAIKDGKARPCLLAEQQFNLIKKNSMDMLDDLMKMLSPPNLYVRPEHFIMDKTGNGLVFHDAMKKKFGDIRGIAWSEKPTTRKILEEDTMTAEEQFKDIISEMWWSASRWLEFGYLKFAPTMPTQEVFMELTSRKYGRFRKTETKAEYKKRTKRNSPDKADSLIMLVHLCRILNTYGRPEMITVPTRQSVADWTTGEPVEPQGDVVQMIDFEDEAWR